MFIIDCRTFSGPPPPIAIGAIGAIVDCSRIHLVAGQGVNAPANGTFRETVTAKYS